MDSYHGRVVRCPVVAKKVCGYEQGKKNYQPVSRILFPRWCGRSSFIWPLHYCRDLAAYPPAQPLAEHRAGRPQSPVYVAFQHARFTRPGSYLPEPWALTPRFQPHLLRGSYFLWHYLWTRERPPALNRYIALRCPDFPPPV